MLTSIPESCPPRYATPRTPSRETDGDKAARYAVELGKPLMPWQRQVFDVALEKDPDTGLYIYKEVVVTVPRQNGKTTLILVLYLLRALATANQRMVYTAQTQSAAKEKFMDDWLPMLEDSPFKKYFTVSKANGQEALRFSNKSLLKLIATTLKAGHGLTLDMSVIDEVFSLQDNRMEQALVPAAKTRHMVPPGPQFWIVSTAGTFANSPYMWRKVQQGRQYIADGLTKTACYFEWSADDDDDPSSPETWRKCNPAWGYTLGLEALDYDFTSGMDLSEFRRADLNQWVVAETDPVIPLDHWATLVDMTPMEGQVAIAFDVAEDRSMSSIAAAQRVGDLWFVEVIASRPGTAWLPKAIAQIWHNQRPIGIWLDRSGPAGSLVAELANLNVPVVHDVPASDLAKACGMFYDAAMGDEGDDDNEASPPTLRHRGEPALTAALDGAGQQTLSDAWKWSRKKSNVDISPLVAVTMALFGAKQFSNTPEVYSIREIMEEKMRAAEEAAKENVTDSAQPAPQPNVIEPSQPRPAAPSSGVTIVPI